MSFPGAIGEKTKYAIACGLFVILVWVVYPDSTDTPEESAPQPVVEDEQTVAENEVESAPRLNVERVTPQSLPSVSDREQLSRINPFYVAPMFDPLEERPDDRADAAAELEETEAERLAKLERTIEKLEIRAIFSSKNGKVALTNSGRLREGDEVEPGIVVVRIETDHVVLNLK